MTKDRTLPKKLADRFKIYPMINNLNFRWIESDRKRNHFYLFIGTHEFPVGFVSIQHNGWVAKGYMPGPESKWFTGQRLARDYVEQLYQRQIANMLGLTLNN